MKKLYQEKNVMDAAHERLAFICHHFERIYVSFSGGKDSTVLLHAAVAAMRRHRPGERLGVLFIDLEAQYKKTIEFVEQVLNDYADVIDLYWICLPLNLRNAVSVFQPFWTCWDEDRQECWVRKMPLKAIHIGNHSFPFFRKNMEFEEFIVDFGGWYAGGKSTACLVGIRSDESLNRFRTIANKDKTMFQDTPWTTKVSENLYNAYPIYDWTTEDIWTAIARHGWSYNHLYDLFYKAGVGIHDQRICQPYGDDQRIGLNLYRVIEPETWGLLVARVNGANFGNIYCGNKINGYRKIDLPPGHTWKSYTKLLLASLPEELANHYKQRFIKFMRYWSRVGSPIADDLHADLPPGAVIKDDISTRGRKNKRLVIYKRVPDALPARLESAKMGPTWRRMAACILKNDHLCKTLSFAQTKNQREKIRAVLDKYRNL